MKHRLITTSILIFSLMIVQSLSAQDTKNLTLNEAVQLSLKNSKQLKSSGAKIAEATAIVQQANDRKLPDFSISGSYIRINNPNVKLHTGGSDSSGGGGLGGGVNSAMYGLANVSYTLYSGGRIKYG